MPRLYFNQQPGASLDLRVTMLTLSLILTVRLILTLQPYPNRNSYVQI